MWHDVLQRRSENKFTWRVISYPGLFQGNSLPADYHLFLALKQNFGGHKFKDDREVETVVTRWPITQDRD
jgi:hypothetical protein